MNPNRFSGERQRRLLASLCCPACGEQNVPNKKAMIEIDEQGHGYCNKCGKTWAVDEGKAT